mgnify:CR=1 FL=1
MIPLVKQTLRLVEKYTPEIGDLLRYLKAGFSADDFAYYIEEFYASVGLELPESFDPDEPYLYVENDMPEMHKEFMKEWIENGGLNDYGAELPSYMFLSDPVLVKRNTWLVHFSDYAQDIYVNGFKYGAQDFTMLGLTTYFSDSVRRAYPGYNFAFEADSKWARAAAGYKYGAHAVMFQSAGVKCLHFGDEEYQVIFYGPNVDELILLEDDGNGYWSVGGYSKSGEWTDIYTGSFEDVVAWVIDNVNQYRNIIVNKI